MKKFLLALALCLGMSAHADEALDGAIMGQGADVVTTVIGIGAFDLVEANPLGVGLAVVKPALVYWANGIEDATERCEALRSVENAGWAPAIANIATIAGVATGGAVAILIGGFIYLQHSTADRCAPSDSTLLEH